MKKYLLYIALGFFAFACENEDLQVLTFETAEKGAFVRLVSLNQDLLIDPSNISGSAIDMDVDFVDPENGATIQDFDIFLTFEDLTPENGDNSKAEVQIRDFTSGDFSTSELGNMGVSVDIPASEMLQALGLAEADLSATDRFRVRSEIIDDQGRVFSADNSSPPISNFMDAFNSAFRYNLNVACPVADDFYSGTYAVEYVTPPNPGGFGPIFGDPAPPVTLVAGGSTVRSFDFTYLPGIGGFAQTITFDLLCNITRVRLRDTGLGCGSGAITIGPGSEDGIMSLTDDSEITITLINYVTDGGCGVGAYENVIRLVKQ